MSEATVGFQAAQIGSLPGLLGFEWTEAQAESIKGRFAVEGKHLAPTGYLHAATVVALADSACGFGCTISLPQDAVGFTTAELKANFLGTAREGAIACCAHLVHGGRTTQVWDAEVTSETTRKTIALFRCTQIILYPKQAR